jgi:hypothetical protein
LAVVQASDVVAPTCSELGVAENVLITAAGGGALTNKVDVPVVPVPPAPVQVNVKIYTPGVLIGPTLVPVLAVG